MPKPLKNETEEKFIKRCMVWPDLQDKTKDQRLGFCYGVWNEHRKKTKSLEEFWHYKLNEDHFGLDAYTDDNLEWDEEEKSIVIPFAASQGRDRVGDFLHVGGISTTNHEKNSIALLDHGANCHKPIGICQDKAGNYTVEIDEERGVAKAKIFLACGVKDFPEPDQCFELYKRGVLKAGSIGFKPIDFDILPPDPENGYFKKAMNIKRCELLEVSLVALPCNQDTVQKQLQDYHTELTPYIKSMLTRKNWSQGVNITMQKDVMSSVDQSSGGALVGPDEEKGYDKEPLGAAVLRTLHSDLHNLHQQYSEVLPQLEHPKVKKLMEKCCDLLHNHKGMIQECFKSAYPDGEPLENADDYEAGGDEPDPAKQDTDDTDADADADDNQSDDNEVKHFRRLFNKAFGGKRGKSMENNDDMPHLLKELADHLDKLDDEDSKCLCDKVKAILEGHDDKPYAYKDADKPSSDDQSDNNPENDKLTREEEVALEKSLLTLTKRFDKIGKILRR